MVEAMLTLEVKPYQEAWKEAYALAKENQPVFINEEAMFTPIFFDKNWIENDIEGYSTYIYSNKTLSNDDLLSLFKKFLRLLKVVRELHIKSKKVEEHLRNLTLLELPVYENGQISNFLLDVFININHSSCLRYDKENSLYNMGKYVEKEFFKLFKCCILSNTSKTKLYGRVFYSEKHQALVNIYPQGLREAFHKKTIYNTKINTYFYINEIICLGKKISINDLNDFDDDIIVCDICSKAYNRYSTVFLISASNKLYCENCAHERLVSCDYCKEYYDIHETKMYRLYNKKGIFEDDEINLCEDCFDVCDEKYDFVEEY